MVANAPSLDGIRVLDLSRVLAGPFCAQTLGDLGAEVIKIERPTSGDDTRGWGPPFQEGESAYFMCANRNKQSVTLDLKSEKGKEILGKLIASSDVVIENFKLNTLENWGFDQAWFDAFAPKTVRCSITGYGSVGEKAKLPGYDFLAQAESGLMSITGPIDGQPVKYGVSIVDFCTGQYAAIAILSALQARQRSGRGQHIECNLYSTGLAMLINVGSSHLMSEKPGLMTKGLKRPQCVLTIVSRLMLCCSQCFRRTQQSIGYAHCKRQEWHAVKSIPWLMHWPTLILKLAIWLSR